MGRVGADIVARVGGGRCHLDVPDDRIGGGLESEAGPRTARELRGVDGVKDMARMTDHGIDVRRIPAGGQLGVLDSRLRIGDRHGQESLAVRCPGECLPHVKDVGVGGRYVLGQRRQGR